MSVIKRILHFNSSMCVFDEIIGGVRLHCYSVKEDRKESKTEDNNAKWNFLD